MSHSLLSPSAAHRWIECPASLAESQSYENKSSVYADEGTEAHGFAADILRDKEVDIPDEEMLENVMVYVNTVKSMSQGALLTLVEQELDTSGVYDVTEQKGTGDFIAVMPIKGLDNGVAVCELQVHDLKYGKGVRVDAVMNWQMIIYALATIDLLEMLGDYTIENVRLVIHQPRLNSVSEAVYTIEELLSFKEVIRNCAQTAMSLLSADVKLSDEHYSPGQKQCCFCPHKANCKALQAHAIRTIADEFEDFTTTEDLKETLEAVKTDDLSIDRLSIIMQNASLISSLLKAIEERVYAILFDGGEIPNFKLVEGRMGSRKWDDDEKAEEVMKSIRLKVDEMYSMKIISPTQAEKVLKDNPRKWKRLEELIVRAEAKPTVVPSSDKRPALCMTQAANEFEDVTTDDII